MQFGHLPVKQGIKDVNDFFNELGYEVVLAGKGHVKPNSVFNWSKYFPNVSSAQTQGFSKKNIPLEQIESYIENSKKPFLMFVASDYPHGPYPSNTNYTDEMIFKTPYDEKFPMYNKKGYYKNVEKDNDQLKALLKMLDNSQIKNNTLFIYAADHGIRGKWGVSEVGLKMPLVIKWPKFIKPGLVNKGLVNVIDILPTLIEIAGGEVSEDLDGKSFKETILKNVEQLNPGTHAEFNSQGNVIFKKWWRTSDHIKELNVDYEQQVEKFKSLFIDACKIRMRSDVPICSSLSGGLDSSSVVCAMSEIRKSEKNFKRLQNNNQSAFICDFTGSSDYEIFSEKKYAESIIKKAEPIYKAMGWSLNPIKKDSNQKTLDEWW